VSSSERQFISPIALRIAKEKGIDTSKIQGTGPNSRIILADIEDAANSVPVTSVKADAPKDVDVKSQKSAAQKVDIPSGLFRDIEVSNIRKIIAERLTHSKQNIPHYYVTISVNMDKVLALRARLNAHATTKISVNDIVMKASAMASIKVPATNSTW
jgi:pyruvate dehydrogenase E2 component (dihydrolipoamide acetyltransferase)